MRAGGQRVTGAARLLLPALVVVLVAGCGTSGTTTRRTGAAPDDAALPCRAQWGELRDGLLDRGRSADASDQASRWGPVIATAEHYAQGATTRDCAGGSGALEREQAAIGRIERFSGQLREFDVPHRMAALAPAATDYLLSPVPQRGGRAERPPSKAQVRDALTVLEQQATAAVTDMRAGWEEAGTVDLADEAAVRRTLADLRFLAGDSTPFQACRAALAVLEEAAAARG